MNNHKFIVLEKVEDTADEALQRLRQIMKDYPSYGVVSVKDYSIVPHIVDGILRFKIVVTLENKTVSKDNSYTRKK